MAAIEKRGFRPEVWAGLGSAALLIGAFGFQHLGGLPPCQLCIWQRWPHAVAVLVLALLLATGWRVLAVLGALAAMTSAGIGLFHLGVEQGWWEFISTCTQGSIAGLSGADLLDPTLATPPPVRCDAIAWSFMGLSMAAWNAVLSTLLAGLWTMAALRRG
ncbi:disulfide bond formation protein B [Xinfangfangia sp. CPCC 101601]|uniref:Disulfide bond formation protein B n=1 Tax=Pseudogemmobacter lacusdianii TaxID=3069608 RepID=A0ABU0VVA2_9RHOB|nr:disulfide bond formation protein B [Xinfangfangia sp. CPCC 101601]MDQ2065639.1 disulfide bond formation protein B [Xinfangfangia sp. CPCC 101601]